MRVNSGDDEWSQLISFLGGNNSAGFKMKSTKGWKDDQGGTNLSGFTGLPGGYRSDKGIFDNLGRWGIWWSSTEFWPNLFQAWSRILLYNGTIGNSCSYKRSGLSIRCLKDD